MPLPPYLFHSLAHGFPLLIGDHSLGLGLEGGTALCRPRLTLALGGVFRFLGVAVREGEFQQAAFHHRDMIDLFPEGVSVKFGCAHQASGDLHEVRFPDALDAAVGGTAPAASPVGNLTVRGPLDLPPAGTTAAATFDSCGEWREPAFTLGHVVSDPFALAVLELICPAVLLGGGLPFLRDLGAVVKVEDQNAAVRNVDPLHALGKDLVVELRQTQNLSAALFQKEDNCRQLYEDLKKIVRDNRESHFFGSIVSSVIGNGASTEYHIIDGQQRLTTVSLLLLAIRNLIRQKKITAQEDRLDDQINDRFLVSPWAKEEDKIKLRPVKSDREALAKLYGDEEDYDPASNLTLNYRFFCDQILKEEISVDELYAAIGKLEIISITLDQHDNAQLIFESLNSTGLALTEGDKIRNYILMGQPPKEQNKLYDTYWTTIERCTGNDVSGFVRDYLSVKQQVTPTISNVYRAFKDYAEKAQLPIESLLEDLRRYARFFEKLLTCKSGLKEKKLDDCL